MKTNHQNAASKPVRAVLFVCAVVYACGDEASNSNPEWTVTEETISGTVHVTNSPVSTQLQPTLVAEEEFRIGTVEGSGPSSFARIREIAILPDGRFAVADAQAEEVRLFSADGAHLRTFGGKGQGPGELLGMQGVHLYNGMLRVAEQVNARLSVFDPDAGFVTSFPLRLRSYRFGGPWEAAVDPDGNTIVSSSGQYGEGRFWSMLRVYDSTMNQIDSIPYHDYTDDVERDEVPGAWRVSLGPNRYTWAPVPFYAPPYSVLTASGEFWTSTEGHSQIRIVRWTPPSDTTLVITSLREPEPVTASERDSAMTALRDRLAENTGSPPRLDPSRVPTTKPPLYGLSLDDLDRIWVRLTEPGMAPTVYDVYDHNGRYSETVQMPFRVDSRVPPVVRGRSVWAVVTDELEVQYVVHAELSPAGT